MKVDWKQTVDVNWFSDAAQPSWRTLDWPSIMSETCALSIALSLSLPVCLSVSLSISHRHSYFLQATSGLLSVSVQLENLCVFL